MSSRCKIEFNRKDEVFYSGETIEGKVTLRTSKPKEVESVSINLFGECKVKWEETVEVDEHGISATIGRNVLWSRKTLVDESMDLYGAGLLQPDYYCWHFDFRLGKHFLTSLESRFGYVRYEVYLLIHRIDRYDNEFVKPISVIKHFDLNSNPSYRESLLSEVTVNTCCWTVTRGNAFCSLSTPFSAYAPGQDIVYNLAISNRSRKRIQGFRVELVKRTTYIAKYPRLSENVVETQVAEDFFPLDVTADINIPGAFNIPPTPPTTYGGGFISIDYILKARGVVSCRFSSDLSTELRIIIGTIPIRESLSLSQLFLPAGLRMYSAAREGDAAVAEGGDAAGEEAAAAEDEEGIAAVEGGAAPEEGGDAPEEGGAAAEEEIDAAEEGSDEEREGSSAAGEEGGAVGGGGAAAVIPFAEYEIRPPTYGPVFPTEPQFVDGRPNFHNRHIFGFRPLYPIYKKPVAQNVA